MNYLYLLLGLTALFTTSIAQAEIFKWVDADGKIHYSDKKPENQSAKEIKIKPHKQAGPIEPSELKAYLNPNKSAESPEKTIKTYRKKHKVTMYAASWCGYCKTARAYFKKNNIRYNEYDIEKNISAKKRYEKLGGTGVPLLVAKRKHM